MTATIAPPMFLQFLNPNNSGSPAIGFKLFTYIAGTSTKQATWTDSTQTIQNANPLALDGNGVGTVWGDPTLAYKFVWAPANDTDPPSSPIRTVDNLYFPLSFAALTQAVVGSILYPRTAIEIAVGVHPVNFGYPPGHAWRYGVSPNNTDVQNTTAMNLAHSTGYWIYYPAGNYNHTAGITIPAGGIFGDGSYVTTLACTDTGGANAFSYTGGLAGVFQNVSFNIASTKSGGAAMVVGPVSGEVSGMRFFQCVFNGYPNGISFVRASLWSVIACNFYAYSADAIKVDNQNNADSGDSVIADCQFTSPGNTSANSIEQVASGGLKVVGNKFNNAGVHVLLNLGANSTSDLIIVGNSFENAHFANIQLQRTSGSAVFQNVAITGNQILASSTTGNSAGIYTNNGAVFINGLTICGNTIRVDDTGSADAIVVDYVTNAVVGENTLIGSGGVSTAGILFGTHNTNAKIGVNSITGFANSINAPAVTNAVASDFQNGTVNVTTSSALGGLFSGTTTVTFGTAFCGDFVPTLQNCSATVTSTGGGGIVAQCTAVSATQLFITVIGVTNGGSVPIQWRAGGVI